MLSGVEMEAVARSTPFNTFSVVDAAFNGLP
jgi:hypothetical protein